MSRLVGADALEHHHAQLLGSALLAGALHHLGDGDAHAQLGLTVRAVLDMLADVGGVLAAQFVVQVLLEFGPGLLAAAVGLRELLGMVCLLVGWGADAPAANPCSRA